MNTPNFLKLGFLSLCTLFLPVAASAQTVIEFDQTAITVWIDSGDEQTVPTGVSWRLNLADSSSVLLAGDTTFKVVEDEEGDQRVILIRGDLVLERPTIDGGIVQLEVDGTLVTSDGAELAISSDASGTSLTQLGDRGTVTVGGSPIGPGTGGSLSDDGSFTESTAVQAQLLSTASDLRRGPPPDRPADPQGKPPYDKLKPLPEEIVSENLNDISPS